MFRQNMFAYLVASLHCLIAFADELVLQMFIQFPIGFRSEIDLELWVMLLQEVGEHFNEVILNAGKRL